MFKEHKKITVGFVIQDYITLPTGKMICQSQTFITGDQVDYEDKNGKPIEVDTSKEVYCPMDMKIPKQLTDDDADVKFLCSDCGHTRIEAVMDGSHTTIIESMFQSGGIEYGETNAEGYLERYQCVGCGKTITDIAGEPITDDEELVERVKENCKQD